MNSDSVHDLGIDCVDGHVTPVIIFTSNHIVEVDGLGVFASD